MSDNKKIIDIKSLLSRLKVIESGLSDKDKKELWEKIEVVTSVRKKKTFHLASLLRYTAVVALLAVSSYYLYNYFSVSPEQIDYEKMMSQLHIPEELSENVTVMVGEKEMIEVSEENAQVVHDAGGQMSINQKTVSTVSESDFNHLYVPYGKTSQVTLSDGTKMWVNSGTKVIYPALFTGNKREIYVEGEIFLEVTHDQQFPFVVKTDLLEVSVLGTSFNVSAYKNDKDQSVVLASGSVSVKEMDKKKATMIKPNQQYTLEKNSAVTHLQNVDAYEYICWKEGFLIFRNEKIENVLMKIERYYNKPITFHAPDINPITVSGKLDLKTNIEETFRIISITAPIEYEIGEREIEISINK